MTGRRIRGVAGGFNSVLVLLSALICAQPAAGGPGAGTADFKTNVEKLFQDSEGATLGTLDVAPSVSLVYGKPSGSGTLLVDAGGYIDINYTWKAGGSYSPPPVGVRAFVHFRNKEGRIITDSFGRTFQDDHDIDPPPGEWASGAEIAYTRSMIKVPENIGVNGTERITVCVGLYLPAGNRRAQLTWDGEQPPDLAYPVAEFSVRKTEERFPISYENFYYPDAPDYRWRWAETASAVLFKRDLRIKSVDLVIAGHSPAEEIGGKQTMKIYIYEKQEKFLVKELVCEHELVEPMRIPIPEKLFNNPEFKTALIRFIFEVEPFLKPVEGDFRKELGFKFLDILLLPHQE